MWDEWYNAVQAQVNLAKYPPEAAKVLHHDIFWFFLHDEEFVSKTINDSNVDLEKFPASKVRQLTKKMDSFKATACHMKQVAGDPQAAQINLMRHQCTEISPVKHKKKKSLLNQNNQVTSMLFRRIPRHQAITRKALIQEMHTRINIGVQSVEIPPMWKEFSALQRHSSVKLAISLDTLPVFVTKETSTH